MADTLLLKKGELVLKSSELVKYKKDCSCCPPKCSDKSCGICKVWITGVECYLCGDGYNHAKLGISLSFNESGKGLDCEDYWSQGLSQSITPAWKINGASYGAQVSGGANAYCNLSGQIATNKEEAEKQYCDRKEKKTNFWIQLATAGSDPIMKTRATGTGYLGFTMYTGNCNYYNNHGSNPFKLNVNMKIEAAKGRRIDLGGISVSNGSTTLSSGWYHNPKNSTKGSFGFGITIT